MSREILSLTREDDGTFGIYLDGELWQTWTEDQLVNPGVLWFKLGRAIQEITERRLAAVKAAVEAHHD